MVSVPGCAAAEAARARTEARKLIPARKLMLAYGRWRWCPYAVSMSAGRLTPRPRLQT